MMGDLLGSFSDSVSETKHVGKTCGDLWGQSTILEAVIGKTCDREGSGHYRNNQMFSIAWAVVEGENNYSWEWFLQHLRNCLGGKNSFGWSFISD